MTTMAPTAPPAVNRPPERRGPRPAATFRFESLVLTEAQSLAKGRSVTFTLSLFLHGILIAAAILIPILASDTLPAADVALRAFFVAPPDVAPPPPPPPPAGARTAVKRAPVAPRPKEAPTFTAPVEIPPEILEEPDLGLDLGAEGGVPGGVEGGVPGGVVGGVVGGLPLAPPPAARVVRIGGQLKPPKLVKRVNPEYPQLASQARAQGVVILEAQVDVHGRVKTVRVLRGHPLFDQVAADAVKQWRYQPLLLNGVPTEFILTVTVAFNLLAPTTVQ